MADLNSSSELPPIIYLQVFAGEDPSQWAKTANSIATILGRDVDSWREQDHPAGAVDWASVAGVRSLLLYFSFWSLSKDGLPRCRVISRGSLRNRQLC